MIMQYLEYSKHVLCSLFSMLILHKQQHIYKFIFNLDSLTICKTYHLRLFGNIKTKMPDQDLQISWYAFESAAVL